jgi:hypothetical protein
LAPPATTIPDVDRTDLAATIEALAAIDRPSTSDGERRAAEWLLDRFTALGCQARIEEEPAYSSYWWTIGALSALSALAGRLVLRGRRLLGLTGAFLAAAGIADEISNGPRPLRRLMLKQGTTWNVVAEAGDPRADRTIVLLAHHDAPHSGAIFNPAPQKALGKAFPDVVENTDTAIPVWAPVVGGPVLVALGALLGSRRLAWFGKVLGLTSLAAMLDIARSPAVPGANDNLSGVAALVGLAGRLESNPVEGIRVVLASCGAEEALQEGIRPFMKRHAPGLPKDQTWFLNFDTIGSPRLVMLEGEGPILMEDYPGDLRDLVADVAEEAGIALRRGQRAKSSTDSVIPARAGYSSACLTSFDQNKSLSNYHWPTDVPGNIDYETVADAVALGDLVIRRLAAR